jgi:hypothetical protein
MNIDVPIIYALAENVLACALTAVTCLTCATKFEAYSTRMLDTSSAWTRCMKDPCSRIERI